jgi:serine/threonine-protein kinase
MNDDAACLAEDPVPGEDDDLMARAQGRVGTVLRGKYRLDGVLGVGGMAVVYKATHRNQAEFAVKMLHPELSIHKDIRTRFLREGYAANSVKHPGVVLVVDDDVAEDGAAFLVMEMLRGASVESLWERQKHRLHPAVALSITDQLLDVLSVAHANGIVHRDIKPANLFVQRDGSLKVLDFGIARVRDAAAGGPATGGTGSGVLLGTPAFMAPEQALARSSEIDAQTDLWAVGATVFALLTGCIVHEGANAAELMVKAATTRARSLGTLLTLPPGVVEVIDRSLAFERQARWSSASTMREALEQACIAAFGQRPTRTALAELVAASQTPEPASAPAARREATVAAPPWIAPTAPPESLPPATEPAPGLFMGGTTAKPVSAAVDPQPLVVPKRSYGPVAAAISVAVLGGGGVLAWQWSSGSPSPAAQASSTTLTPVPSSPTPAVIASSVLEAMAGPAPSHSAPDVAKPPGLPGAKASTPARAVPAASAKATSTAASKPANCDPDYYYDSAGKHFKPECFVH